MKGIILHGGQGTRLRPLTHTGPKQLINIAGKPISQWALEKLKDAGVDNIAIVLGENSPRKVIEYYGDGRKFGVNIEYIYQGKARGIAEAIYRCKDFIDNDDFIVYLGDNVLFDDILPIASNGSDASLLLAHVKDPRAFGVAVTDGDRIVKLVEKPKEIISDLALIGVYYFKPIVFDYIAELKPSWRNELEITEALQDMIDDHRKVTFKIAESWWKDTGNPNDLLEANMKLLDRFGKEKNFGSIENSEVLGRSFIGYGSIIHNSKIIGPVHIGNNVTIENARVGPYTTIGDRSEVKDADIEYSLILDSSVVNNIRISESIIGSESKIAGDGKNSHYRIVVGEKTSIVRGW
ncbi:glucose-1-phosphate thymidylyltransferase [Thermoplasma sp. Kam2015]|uniref:glucose-1-phosphate thymidylyltransferase n=1 Tax=Thermoplasma sp. Kam2015 TaxID=2094122 RepID=UPI000D8F7996|nr:glucose-1-phosphate thymidylyltransferase [Thermoplasma sp. Kam2015]PYB68455.1 glucose-1-phosphate thymidylyltransferase [Thermoplasma sp. Kam2015]